MAEINTYNLKGSTLVETLFALVIVALAFGFGSSFINAQLSVKNLKSYTEVLELREISKTQNARIDQTLHTETIFFRDSVCLIKKQSISSLSNRYFIHVTPLNNEKQ